jgi:peptidoglycan hydrolase-like protein with peptidoglycan-binding domain
VPLTIQTSATPVGAPILEDPSVIAELADRQGSIIPPGGTVIAITIPIIRSDQTGLQYFTRNRGTEFIFNTGTLRLSLRQEIHMSNGLGPCAQTIWLQHERKHVQDNEAIMLRMDHELRADQEFRDILVAPSEWRPRSRFQATQDAIQDIVADIFERLTSEAAARQDTSQEYRGVDRQVRLRCGHTLSRILRRGNYGDGVDLVQIALNAHPPSVLPPLQVDGVFGPKTETRVKEFQRLKHLSDDGVVGPDTKAALGL